MIKLNNISFSYDNDLVLNDFSLQIKRSDRICLFGKSGCGKTTALRLILGLETPQKGEIIRENKLKPAVVFQEDRLLHFKTVIENVTIFGAEYKDAMINLTKLGLNEYADSFPCDLSGGMCRRVAIARAITNQFDLLVLDEPFKGLDENNISICVKLINEIIKERPLILVTHSKPEAELLNCKIIEML